MTTTTTTTGTDRQAEARRANLLRMQQANRDNTIPRQIETLRAEISDLNERIGIERRALARAEKRAKEGQSQDYFASPRFYLMEIERHQDRIAGIEAEIARLQPKDGSGSPRTARPIR